ncbi:MAG: hypothetical protein CME25_03275 [Gemmatimonadetes bacterium]|nr:hypothetical protein [Gemmatimonadota bacterium]
MDLAKFQDDRVISERQVVVTESDSHCKLPIRSGDLEGINEVRAEVFLPEGAEGQLHCRITSGERTEGMSEDDGYQFNAIVSPRGGNIWEGWREFRFPNECFYTQGIPWGWGQISSGFLDGPTGTQFRNVRLVERERVVGPRISDVQLLQELNLNHQGLERASKAESDDKALSEIVWHFRSGSFDRELITSEGEDRAFHLDEANRILEGNVLEQDWSEQINWEANPTGYIEWTLAIHYLLFLRPAIDAFFSTGEAKYAIGIERYVADWLKKCPVPFGVRAGGYPWGHSLVGAIRPFSSLVDIFRVICACPETDDRTVVDLLKSFFEHEQYLLQFQSFPPSNKTIAEGRTLAALGCVFPEFKDAGFWREEGYRRLLDDMDIQVMGDGASYELTPGYQMSIAKWFLESFRVAQKFEYDVDPVFEAGIRSMYRWSTAIARPDFTRPSVSDAGSLDSSDGLTEPGRVLNDDEAVWVGTRGKEGERPSYDSIALEDSGYFVMRSGWGKDDRYLLFEGGPYGRWHQHEDKLGLEVYAYGTPFIVDPGITSYYTNPWTSFYTTTQAHNTVMVDGCAQARGRNQSIDQWVQSARPNTVWRSDERSDAAVATYDSPYAGLEEEVSHRRSVLFVKPDYFVLFDELQGQSRHTYEALFHFMPFRVLIDPQSMAVRTGRMNAANLEILPLTRMSPSLVCGQDDPVQGWLAMSGEDVPAPVVIYKKKASLPFRTGYVIYPFSDGQVTAGISTRITKRDDSWTIRITHADGTQDRLKMNWSGDGAPELL